MAAADLGVSGEHFVWAIGHLCRIHCVPFDPALIRQRFPPPHGVHAVLSAAEALGFRHRNAGPISAATRHTRPCLLLCRPANRASASRGARLAAGNGPRAGGNTGAWRR